MSTPFMDAWRFIMWDKQTAEGELSLLGILVSHHNEHPYGLPGVLYIVITRLTGSALWVLAILSTCAMCATSAIVYATSRKECATILGAAAAALIFLSTRGSENLLYGFQIGFPLTVLFGVIAIITSSSERKFSTPLMIMALIAGGFCSATFIAAYPATIAAALSSKSPHRKARAGAALFLFAAWGYHFLPIMIGPSAIPIPVLDKIYGLLILAGSPFTSSRLTCAIIGAFVLVTFAAIFKKNPRSAVSYIGLFSLIMIGTVAFGRGDFGGLNPSRYSTLGTPLVAATIALSSKQWKYISALVFSISIFSLALNIQPAYTQAKLARSQEKLASSIVSQADLLSDHELTPVLPAKPEILRPLIAHLKEISNGRFSLVATHNQNPLTIDQFDSNGRQVMLENGKQLVSGRGHAFIRKKCTGCAFRATLTNVSISGFSWTESANLGFLYLDKEKRIIRNDSYPLNQTQAAATWYSYAPEEAAYVDIYVYSPQPDEKVSFDNLSVERM